MARLPQPGGDQGNWGQILNDFLLQAHDANGSIKSQGVTSEQLAVTGGTDGQILAKDSAAPGGLAWHTPSVSSGSTPVAMGGDLTGTSADAQLAAGTVGTAELADGAVSNAKLVDGVVTSAKIADGTILESDLSNSVVTKLNAAGSGVADGSVSAVKLNTPSGSTNGQVLVLDSAAPGGFSWQTLSTGSATPVGAAGGDLSGVYPNPRVADGAITTVKLADSAVDGSKLAADSVTSAHILDGTIQEVDLAQAVRDKLNATGTGTAPVTSVNAKTGDVVLAKSDVGLGNVDNTSDLAKPISTATQAALDAKMSTSLIGQPNGVAGLDGTGHIDTATLKDYAVRGEVNTFTQANTVTADSDAALLVEDTAHNQTFYVSTANQYVAARHVAITNGGINLQAQSAMKFNHYWSGTQEVYSKDGPAYEISSDASNIHLLTAPSGVAGAPATLATRLSVGDQVVVGDHTSMSDQPTLFVVDSYDNATAPANPTNGAMFYDTTAQKFLVYENNTWKSIIGNANYAILDGPNQFTGAQTVKLDDANAFAVLAADGTPALHVDTVSRSAAIPLIVNVEELRIKTSGSTYYNAYWDSATNTSRYIGDGGAFDTFLDGSDLITSSKSTGTAGAATVESGSFRLTQDGRAIIRSGAPGSFDVQNGTGSESILLYCDCKTCPEC